MTTLRETTNRLPNTIIWAIIAICTLPFLLHLLGFDFGNVSHHLDPQAAGAMTDKELQNALFDSLAGAFTHFLLEWSAVAIAIATAILAFIQCRITGNPATPIIGMALFCAGCMDAFHALAATNLIRAVAENENFIPFTWALSRMFNVLILLIGAGIFLSRFKSHLAQTNRNRFVFIVSGAFLLVSLVVVQLCAMSTQLPDTMYPQSIITRPYDVAPLVLFSVAGLWIFPKFFKREKSVFSHALMWSMVPAIATQLHMAFGSYALFDHHFNIAHFLKAISYLVPFTGMAIDYVSTYQEEKWRLAQWEKTHQTLARKNKELEQFAYIASHDLQEPLRTVNSFVELLMKDYHGKLDHNADTYLQFISQAATRMSTLIKGLLDYSRIGQDKEPTTVDCNSIIKEIQADFGTIINESQATLDIDELPKLKGYETELRLLFQNLISNAIKFQKKGTVPQIKISAQKENKRWKFSFADNGIGIATEHKQRIFSIFQRLHTKSEYDGTGIGLAHCQKIVDLHGGKIWVESKPNEGSTFYLTIPI